MDKIKNGVKIALTIVGTTIGAGFASGRELWEFFGSYGLQSIVGILIAISLFGLSSIFILWISYTHKTENYYQVLEIIMGGTLAKIFDGFIFLYLFSGSVIMFAGSGATFEQWDLSYFTGVIILALAVWLILIKGVNGLITLNMILIPFLITTLIYVSFQYIRNHELFEGDYFRAHLEVWPSAITYVAVNIISLLGVLSTMGRKINSKAEMIFGGVLSAVTLGIIALFLNLALLKVRYVQQYEIPLFSLLPTDKSLLLVIVSIVLWFAIYTTIVSNIHSLVYRLQRKIKVATGKLAVLIIITMLPLTIIGFSTLVNFLYPLYGVLNLYVLFVILLYPFQTTG